KLRRYARGRYLAVPHLRALLLVFRTPRIHDGHALVDAARSRSTRFADVDRALVLFLIDAPPKGKGMRLKNHLDRMLRRTHGAGFTIQYWDGERRSYGDGAPEFMLRLPDA